MIMSDERKNDVNSYEQRLIPNKPELSRLIKKARGNDRNMNEFAEECGTSASTLSRIVNCKNAQAVDPDLLVKIAEHADPESGVEAFMLFEANGMIPKELAEQRGRGHEGFFREPQVFARENNIKSALVSDLMARGNLLQSLREINDEQAGRYVRSTGRTNMILKVSGCETEYWKFRIMGTPRLSRLGFEGIERINYTAEARILLTRLAEVFLADMWEPDGFKICKLSFVFDDEVLYKEFTKLIEDKCFNNWFSNILIDMGTGEVVEEFVYKRYDGEIKKSPLDYPRMDDGTDDDALGMYPYGDDE